MEVGISAPVAMATGTAQPRARRLAAKKERSPKGQAADLGGALEHRIPIALAALCGLVNEGTGKVARLEPARLPDRQVRR